MADTDIDSRYRSNKVMNFAKRDYYTGFQPFMTDHFSKFEFNGDGFLRFAECRKGMQTARYNIWTKPGVSVRIQP